MRKALLTGAILLATVTAAAAQTQQQSGVNPSAQVATMHDRATDSAIHTDGFISPNDPRYQENGAPRVGEEPVFNTPYAPIQGGGPGGNGNG